jgi:hypothetical protein
MISCKKSALMTGGSYGLVPQGLSGAGSGPLVHEHVDAVPGSWFLIFPQPLQVRKCSPQGVTHVLLHGAAVENQSASPMSTDFFVDTGIGWCVFFFAGSLTEKMAVRWF